MRGDVCGNCAGQTLPLGEKPSSSRDVMLISSHLAKACWNLHAHEGHRLCGGVRMLRVAVVTGLDVVRTPIRGAATPISGRFTDDSIANKPHMTR